MEWIPTKRRSLILPDERSFLPPGWSLTIAALFAVLLNTGCDNHSTEPDTVAGAESERISFPVFPNFPTLPAPPGGTVMVTTDQPAATTPTATTTPTSTGTTTETLSYNGRYNGDRPTWYGKKKLSAYPATITIDIPGCITKTISNNGSRYESGGLIVKQSDVSGRGMAIVMASSCKSTSASVRY